MSTPSKTRERSKQKPLSKAFSIDKNVSIDQTASSSSPHKQKKVFLVPEVPQTPKKHHHHGYNTRKRTRNWHVEDSNDLLALSSESQTFHTKESQFDYSRIDLPHSTGEFYQGEKRSKRMDDDE